MKKYLLVSSAVCLLGLSAAAESIVLTFDRTSTTVESVTTNVEGAEGVTSQLLSINPATVALKNSGTAVTSGVLCVDQQRTSLTYGDYIGWTFSVANLPENCYIKSQEVTFGFLTSTGATQGTDSGPRHMTPSLWNGASENSLTSFVELPLDNMYESGAAIENGLLQKKYKFFSETPYEVTSEGYVFSVRLYRPEADGQGCFYGITKVTIEYSVGKADYSPELNEYRTAQIAGIKNCPNIFASELTTPVENLDLTSYERYSPGKTVIDNAVGEIYATLNGKTCTFHNRYDHSTDNETPVYLSAKNGTTVSGVTVAKGNSVEWTLTHKGGNSFVLSADDNYMSHIDSFDGASYSGGPEITLEQNPETPKTFALEPYSDENHPNAVAIRAETMTDQTPPSNGARVYVQYPKDFQTSASSTPTVLTENENSTCHYFYNVPNTNSAKKGAWVMTLIQPGATSISEVTAPAVASDAVFDLSGRRVVNPTHGIYIQNGRKIIR